MGTAPAPAARGLVRSRSDRLAAGVAGGLGARFGIDPVLVRLAFVFLSVAALAGTVLYAAAWVALPETEDDGDPATRTAAPPERSVAFGLIVLGVALALRRAGLWFGDGPAVAVGLGVLGSALLHARADREVAWLSGRGAEAGSAVALVASISPWRALAGAVLVALGAVTFLATTGSLGSLRDLLLATTAAVAGLALLVGPFVWRLVTQAVEERTQRVRSEERAEVAAHLHDSVLQTLALIQRTDDPRRMIALARRQERELRAWLYAGPTAGDATLSSAMARIVEDVETAHAVAVDLVVVGDRPLGPNGDALTKATHEAVRNAALHAGGPVSVYVESDEQGIEAFVRDRGPGFDVDAVPPDRRGVRDSIVRRVERRGGRATITSGTDGTEVTMWVPTDESEGPA